MTTISIAQYSSYRSVFVLAQNMIYSSSYQHPSQAVFLAYFATHQTLVFISLNDTPYIYLTIGISILCNFLCSVFVAHISHKIIMLLPTQVAYLFPFSYKDVFFIVTPVHRIFSRTFYSCNHDQNVQPSILASPGSGRPEYGRKAGYTRL